MVLRCAGRTRPKVSHSQSSRKPGVWSLMEARRASRLPMRSQNVPLMKRRPTGSAQDRSISLRVRASEPESRSVC